MAKKLKEVQAPAEEERPAEVAQEERQQQPVAAPPLPAEPAAKVKKADAIREAIREMGGPASAKNADVIQYVKQRYNLDVTTGQVSLYKKPKKGDSREMAPKADKAEQTREAGPGFSADDILTIKALADRFGVEEVKKILDAFNS